MPRSISRTEPVFSVSVAANLAGMHAQTVRQYDRLGLVVASRTRGGGRRYSLADVEALQEVQRLSQDEGINLAGIARIMELQRENDRLRKENSRLRNSLERLRDYFSERQAEERRVFAGTQDGSIVTLSRGQRVRSTEERRRGALVLWRKYDW